MPRGYCKAPDGSEICFETRGDGATALVFVHGLACNRMHWEHQIDSFADCYTTVALDLGGFGESCVDRDTNTAEAFAGDVIAVIEELSLGRVVLLGHSMGGYVIPLVARRLADAVVGLVGVDTWSALDRNYDAPDFSAFKMDFEGAMIGFVKAMFPPDADKRIVERVTRDMSSADPAIVLDTMANMAAGGVDDILLGLNVPKLAIGSDTFLHKSADVAGRYGIELHKMENVGHFMMLEQPEAFNALLRQLLRKTERLLAGRRDDNGEMNDGE